MNKQPPANLGACMDSEMNFSAHIHATEHKFHVLGNFIKAPFPITSKYVVISLKYVVKICRYTAIFIVI